MTARLTLTNAGAAAIADGANVGTAAVEFTRLALGSGTGMGDQSARIALEARQDIEDVTGNASSANRIALRADYVPTAAYAVTEVGLYAKVGQGSEFLAAYWIAESATEAIAAAAAQTSLVIAGVVEVTNADADITVTPAVNIAIGVPADVVRTTDHATVDKRGILELATDLEHTQTNPPADKAATPAGVRAVRDALLNGVGAQHDTLKEIADELASGATARAALMNAIAGKVAKAGDTMTGALNLPVVPGNADDARAVYAEWVNARITEALANMPTIKKRWLYYNSGATGLEITNADAGILVNLEASLADFRFLEFFGYQGATKIPIRSVSPLAVADIPASRGTTGPAVNLVSGVENATSFETMNVWRPSNNSLRLERGGSFNFFLRAIIGYGDDTA